MKKSTKTILIVIASVAVLAFLVLFVAPRVVLAVLINKDIELMNYNVQEYTYTDVTAEGLVPAEIEGMRISLPQGLEAEESTLENFYKYTDGTQVVGLDTEANAGMNILSEDFYEADGLGTKLMIALLTDGFEKLGLGMPDSSYAYSKVVLSINEDTAYNPLSLSESLAYYIAGNATPGYMNANGVYFYEGEDKYFWVIERYFEEEGNYKYVGECFPSDNLDETYTFVMQVEEPKTAFAILNSFEFVD